MYLRPGDIFLSKGAAGLSKYIVKVESFYAPDCYAEYSHGGIIFNDLGLMFEGGLVNKRNNLFHKYTGKQILIGRHDEMHLSHFYRGKKELLKHENTFFAIHRLFLLLFPPLARRMSFLQYGVCSEFISLFLYHAGFIDYWRGVMPSDVSNIIRYWKGWHTVYEGVL